MKEPVKKLVGFRSNNRVSLKGNAEMSSFVYGKVPPQAPQLEEAVLGALMLDKDAVALVVDILKPNSFYADAHGKIYQAIMHLFEKSIPIDMLTVTEELKKMGELESVGGAYYIVELTNKVASAANVEHHARIVSQKHIQRELIRVSNDLIRDSYDETTDVFELLDSAEQGLFSITESNLRSPYIDVGTAVGKTIKILEEISNRPDGLSGVPSGFTDLDRLTGGWQQSALVIIAARPGMGKTALTMALMRNAAFEFKKGVAFFSLEMDETELVKRLISMETGISSEKMRSGKLEPYEWQQLMAFSEKLSEVPIFLDTTPALNVFELRAKCRRLKMQHDIQLVIIDYLQLMSGDSSGSKNGNREQEISQISRSLKGLAKELRVPVIALAQLSRAVEVRGGSKRPQLSDLRESGAIEQDADIVSFIYRPEYYQIMEDEDGNSTKGIAEIIVAKHRGGAQGTVKLKWEGEFTRFSNLEGTGLLPYSGGTDDFFDLGGETFSSKINDDLIGGGDIPF